MEERNEELEMSADTELKKKLRFRHLKTARRLQQIQSLKKGKTCGKFRPSASCRSIPSLYRL